MDKYIENEKVFVDDMNNIHKKKGNMIDDFSDMLFDSYEDSKGLLE